MHSTPETTETEIATGRDRFAHMNVKMPAKSVAQDRYKRTTDVLVMSVASFKSDVHLLLVVSAAAGPFSVSSPPPLDSGCGWTFSARSPSLGALPVVLVAGLFESPAEPAAGLSVPESCKAANSTVAAPERMTEMKNSAIVALSEFLAGLAAKTVYV